MTYQSIAAHRSMALDAVRNEAYGAAIREVVGPRSVVLDLGAGTGVLGLMAARAGARRVYLVEPEDIIAVAGEVVRANRLEDVVRCVQGRVEEVQLPEPVDVIVSVLTGNFLLTEDLLGSLFHARDAWLAPGGALIPSAARMRGVPVSAPRLFEKEVAAWSLPHHGVDLASVRSYAANTIYYRTDVREAEWLSEPATLHEVDFATDTYAAVSVETAVTIAGPGLCHGWAGWFDMKLGDRWLSTSPRDRAMHWTPAFLPLDPPVRVGAGERMTLQIARSPFGDWTWTTQSEAGRRRHSTLLSAPLTGDSLDRASLAYAPALNMQGGVLLDALSRFDGASSVEKIAAELQARHQIRFRTAEEALRFVRGLLKPFA